MIEYHLKYWGYKNLRLCHFLSFGFLTLEKPNCQDLVNIMQKPTWEKKKKN